MADWADIDLSDVPDRRPIDAARAAQAADERLAGLVDGLLPPAADPVPARWESWEPEGAQPEGDRAGTEPHGAQPEGDQAGTEPGAWRTPTIDGRPARPAATPAGGWVEETPPLGAHEVTTAADAGWDAARPDRGDSWVHALGRFVDATPDAPRRDS